MPGFIINQDSVGIPKPQKPVLQHMWAMQQLVGAPVPIGGAMRGDNNNALVYVKSYTPPNYSFSLEEADTGHITYKVAKKVIWEDVIINFYDTAGLKDWLVQRKHAVWDPYNGIKSADTYKFNSILKTFPQDWSGDIDDYIEVWMLRNSWISRVSWSDLTYTASDVVNITVTVSYDWAVDNIIEEPEPLGGGDGLLSNPPNSNLPISRFTF